MGNEERILITGGLGFVGTNLARRLNRSSATIIDNGDCRGHPMPSKHKVLEGDVRDAEVAATACAQKDVVVHLAALGSVVESVADPVSNFESNVLGTFNVLRAAQRSGVRRFVFASTGGALIGEAPPPVDENALPKPISPYGASKLCGEAYCHAFAKAYGMETVCLRFANVYGPWSAHKRGAVTTFIKCLMTRRPITIFGDGSATRDFLYVDDICDGIMLGASSRAVRPGDVFHIASGRETSVLELAYMLREIANRPNHPIEFKPARASEVSHNFARYDKARMGLGFEPKWALREGLEATWQWFNEQGERALYTSEIDS